MSTASDQPMSIHDFHGVDLPFETAAGGFVNFVSDRLIAALVTEAWAVESSEVGRTLGYGGAGPVPVVVDAWVGRPRPRLDALVLPIAWSGQATERGGSEPIPPIEADLELVAFGAARSHLHLLGVSRLRPGTPGRTSRASLEQRLAVAIARHVLVSLANSLEGASRVEAHARNSAGWPSTTTGFARNRTG